MRRPPLQRKTVLFSRGDLMVAEAQIQENYLVPHDLGTLKAKAGHQTLLIEGEGINATMQGVGAEAPGHPFVHDDDARAGANLPAARIVYPAHRILVHQKQGVTKLLN